MPSIDDFFPPFIFTTGIFGDPGLFSMTRMTLVRLIATTVLVLIFAIVAARAQMVPGRLQSIVEMGMDFVRVGIAQENLGKRLGKKYAPILTLIFFGILFFNITSIIPGMNIAASSVVAVPLVFAVLSYVTFISAGIKEQGAGHFFKSQLIPEGAPWPILIILTPIEFFSTFIVRPATLIVRLMANMISGHILLALCYFGTQTLLVLGTQGAAMRGVGVLTLFAALVMTAFELFVIVLQAYVFTILSCIYIKLSVEAH